MFLKSKGNSIAQYAIIMALVSIAMVPILFNLGQMITSSFEVQLNWMNGNNLQMQMNIAPQRTTLVEAFHAHLHTTAGGNVVYRVNCLGSTSQFLRIMKFARV